MRRMRAGVVFVGLIAGSFAGAMSGCEGRLPIGGTGGGPAPPIVPTGEAGSSGGNAGTSGEAGTSGGAGTTGGSAVTTGGGGGGEFGQPACPSTVARAGSCTPEDVQFCYKRCGPQSIGIKSETCTASVYAEMSGCTFDPAGDYSCYKIPTAANAACPAGILQPNNPCSVAPCTLCNSAGGTAAGTYTDSAGAERPGYCVCAATGKWSCASAPSWPCPAGSGC